MDTYTEEELKEDSDYDYHLDRLSFEDRKKWFREQVVALDRYGIPDNRIVCIIEALTDLIDDSAHGRGGYESDFRVIERRLKSLKCSYMKSDRRDV